MAVSVCMATYNGGVSMRRCGRSSISFRRWMRSSSLTIARRTNPSLIDSFCDPRIRLLVNDQRRREVYSFGQAIG